MSITSLRKSASYTRNAYNFVDGCFLYMKEPNLIDAACKVCFAEKSCRQGAELIESISKMKSKELPEFLSHGNERIRSAAKKRLEELCI